MIVEHANQAAVEKTQTQKEVRTDIESEREVNRVSKHSKQLSPDLSVLVIPCRWESV